MFHVRPSLRSLLLFIAAAALGCGGDALTPPGTTTGTLEIATRTAGTVLDPDGYTFQIDGGAAQPIGVTASAQSPDVGAGDHSVVLAGMAANCAVSGDNPRSVSVSAGQTATVSFAVTCGATTGGLQVTATTTGTAPDADGYTVTVDGAGQGTLGATGTVTIAGLAPGTHAVGLSGVAANCTVQGDNPHPTIVAADAGTRVAFAVTCITPPANAGTLRVITATTGSNVDADGYTFAVDGAAPQPIGVQATTTLANVTSGSHSVQLSGVASTCTVQGTNPRAVTVAGGSTVDVKFEVTCTAVPPTPTGLRWHPMASGSTVNLLGVWGSSATDVFAVGGTTILHYDGTAWSEQSKEPGYLTSVWGSSATDVFALGGLDGEAVLRHNNGSEWQAMPQPSNTPYPALAESVWGSSGTDVFAAGRTVSGSTNEAFVLHHDGTGWSRMNAPSMDMQQLMDVAGTSSSDVYAVGYTTEHDPPPLHHEPPGLIYHYDGVEWKNLMVPGLEGMQLNGVWASSPSDVFVVAGGVVLHFNGAAWSQMAVPAINNLQDVWGTSASDVYAVGDGILHYDGATWTKVSDQGGSDVWGSSPTDVFVVGSGGTILHGTP